MKRLSCGAVRRKLSALHDGELPVDVQIAVEAHLRGCRNCSTEAVGLRELGDVLREGAALTGHRADDLQGLQDEIVNRIRVEQEESVPAQVSRAFEDMRLGLAALGSTAATLVSILVMIGIFYFAPRSERTDSLAGVLETLGAQPVGAESGTLMPRSAGDGPVSDDLFSEEDAVFTLSAVVTRNGRIANLQVVLAEQETQADRARVVRLLDEVSRARLEPARVGGARVAIRTVWLFAHTTVRGKLPLTPKQSALPRLPQQLLG